jgi:DNA gyrase subunit A
MEEVIDVSLIDEARMRYLTYAMSVVKQRALPDVRDGLKPVQRRILYAMAENLSLLPEKPHRKSAAVVGEVLARYHPHGDGACYEAMVRMAQPFSYRYPLVDGQGNFGSLDGDSPAAYRYTEARLTSFALEVIGDLAENTVPVRPNFDQTVTEPIVFPTRVPHLLVNGVSGIAVGMATAIPPHHLGDTLKTLIQFLENPEVTEEKLIKTLKAPDFPTNCQILNTPEELVEIYKTGRGPIRMRGSHILEDGPRGKKFIILTSIPYGIEKNSLVEKIADCIIEKKLPQLADIRDESTDIVRVVLELSGDDNISHAALAEKVLRYLYKNTPLQTNFYVNMTALVPVTKPGVENDPHSIQPEVLSLKAFFQYFADFRRQVVRAKLTFLKEKLEDRLHVLQGLISIRDRLDEIIALVRKSDGRADSIQKLQKAFDLSERQAEFIVDLRVYQLSKTSVADLRAEFQEKDIERKRLQSILDHKEKLTNLIIEDVKRIAETFKDPRRSEIISEGAPVEINAEEYLQHEEVYVILTKDGWVKRIRQTNDPMGTRIREGDEILLAKAANTKDILSLVTNQGNHFALKVYDLPATPGFGDPVQKLFRFEDGEAVVWSNVEVPLDEKLSEKARNEALKKYLLTTKRGLGFISQIDFTQVTKKGGRRLARISEGNELIGLTEIEGDRVVCVSELGAILSYHVSQIPEVAAPAKGVALQKIPSDDRLLAVLVLPQSATIEIECSRGGTKELSLKTLTLAERGQRGEKLYSRNTPILQVKKQLQKVKGK